MTPPSAVRWRLLRAAAAALVASACAVTVSWVDDDPEFDAWRAKAEGLRELDFQHAVKMKWMNPDQVGGVVAEELAYALPENFETDYRDAYVALGVLPPDIDLYDTLLSLHEEELVGLYSVHTSTLYVLREDESHTGYESSMIVVHELVHALQHQHFPRTVRTLQGVRRNDDLVTAMSAVLEGDASLTMLPVESEWGRTLEDAERLRNAMLVELEFPEDEMAAAPLLLRTSLIFPYAHGAALAARRYTEDGNGGLDALMTSPPLSTLRVIEPDDTDPVEFIRLPTAELAESLSERGCRVGHDNVAGVLTLQVLFDLYTKEAELDALLRHWAGDRFAHFVCSDGGELAWLVRWDDEASARDFARRYQRIAPAASQAAGFAGLPDVEVDGKGVWILSQGLATQAELAASQVEIRPYDDFTAWLADGCFPESCP